MHQILNVGCANINSLIPKVNYVSHMIGNHKLSIVGICETHLNGSVADSFVSTPGFQVMRGDGASGARIHGVCLYISDVYKFEPCDIFVPNVACCV